MALSGATGDDGRSDDPFLIMFNAWWEPLDLTIPDSLRNLAWQIEVDTSDPGTTRRSVESSAPLTLAGRSLVLVRGDQR